MAIPDLHMTGILAIVSGALIVVGAILVKLGNKLGSKVLLYGHLGVIAVWLLFMYSFLVQDYSLYPVYQSSSSGLPWYYKLASSWANGSGSLLLLAGVSSLLYITYYINKSRLLRYPPSIVALLGLTLAFINKAFNETPVKASEGLGLNPLLKSFWVYPHPIATFTAYSILLNVVFLAVWGQINRTLIYIGWSTLTLALLLGGIWSYETLGWGGYWAWDPVETAQIIPWLFLTAYFHSKLIDINAGYASLFMSGASILFAIYVTRAGVSPLHGFSDPAAQTGLITVLLAGVLIALAIANLYRVSGGIPKTLRGISLFTSYIVLMYMGSALLASLATGVIGASLGFNITPLSWDPAVSLYTPLLAPGTVLILISLIVYFGYTLGKGRLMILMLLVAFTSGVMVLLSMVGILVWSPLSPLTTNVLISILVSLASTSSILAALQLYKFKAKLAGHSMIHLGLSILIIGIAVSGPYAYNQDYFKELVLAEGSRISIYGKDLLLKSIRYDMVQDSYINATGYYNTQIYINALQAMDYAYKLFDSYPGKLQRAIEEADSLRIDKLVNGVDYINFSFTSESCNASGTGSFRLLLNPRLDGLGSDYVAALNGTLVQGLCKPGIYDSGMVKIVFDEDYIINIYNFRAVVNVDSRILLLTNNSVIISYDQENVSLDSELNSPIWYWYALYTSNPTFRELVSITRELEEQDLKLSFTIKYALNRSECISLASLNLAQCNLNVLLSSKLLETAYMTLDFIVDGESRRLTLRYDVQGELQGIRGLVPRALIVRDGLSDIYMEVYPQVVNLSNGVMITKLTQYYLSQVFSASNKTDSVALSFIIASSLLTSLNQANVDQLTLTLTALKLLDMGLKGVDEDVIIARVKVVENIQLVWLGGLLMAIGGLVSLRDKLLISSIIY